MNRGAAMLLCLAGVVLIPEPALAQDEPHTLSPTRQLRRVHLTLTGQQPTLPAYEAILAQPDDAVPDAIRQSVDDLLGSQAFHDQLVLWAHDLLGVSSYNDRASEGNWTASRAVQLTPCPEGTVHEGALGTFNNYPQYGDEESLCDDFGAPVADIEPWWAPGTTVRTIGGASTEEREFDGLDCGQASVLQYSVLRPGEGCSCGPNLIYCARRGGTRYNPRGYDGHNHDLTAQRRSAYDEPARLLAHIVMNDRPLSDLVLGDYTVVNQGLYHMYQRAARQNPANAWLDDSDWWRDWGSDPAVWREVRFSELHPHLLDDRDYTFDPRSEDGDPEGIPSAGVLTALVVSSSFARERVRAARWLERLTCREFSPPPADVAFNAYQRDPATEGVCQHCHQTIDPAAIHFKRLFDGGAYIAGIGPWRIDNLVSYSETRQRFESAFIHDTWMTPVSSDRIASHPNARLIDFLPEGQTLFGVEGDGTIGPLGFGKLIVESGEFDRCMVMRLYARFMGRSLVRGQDDALIEDLQARFISSDRNVRALIRHILARPEFYQGW